MVAAARRRTPPSISALAGVSLLVAALGAPLVGLNGDTPTPAGGRSAAGDVTPEPDATPSPSQSAAPSATIPGDGEPSATPSGSPAPDGSMGPTTTPPGSTVTPGATARTGTSPPATPKPTAAPTPRPTFATPPPRAASSYILVAPSELRRLPTSGASWSWVREVAGRKASFKIATEDSEGDIVVFARALVYARTDDVAMRASVVDALRAVVGTEAGGRTLGLGRNLTGYVIAADLIDLRSADPAFDRDVFRPWLRSLFTKRLDGDTLVGTAETRPNNWGLHAGAARIAAARYLGDGSQLARQAKVFRGWLGDRSSYAGFRYGDLDWQCDPAKPVGINPKGCTRDGHSIDGVLPDDQRRGGGFRWPPPKENYAWEGLQGAVLQAELLYQAGYAAWTWEDAAILRAVRWLVDEADYPADGDDRWQPFLIDARYGTSYAGAPPKTFGKSFGFTDWLYR